MDYHKEKYNQQVKEKDRAKSKSEVTLRKGDCKEVRFSGKTEQKDLQMKANTVKRLMERGYRVKVPADGIIISGHSLAIDESSMTGESKILCSSNNELYSPSQALVRTHMVWKKDKKRIRRMRCTCYFPSHCRHP
ncbi:hypothetical protein HYC85_031546 [Camellia sinensis]|uniref:P-type ATPase A domain-containing protein n=1 Tax=Camellia sinensis TaxID=4442 RepID=A0A7J7FQU1_CAMSI|nr:hypothetical protein HYC85_031546 [Camellia sinensis]